MESNKTTTTDTNKTAERTASAVTTTGGQNNPTASAPQRAREVESDVKSFTEEARKQGEQAYQQTKQVVSNAYEKTSEALNDTYNQAMSYGRDNPGTVTLIAFGAGVGIGLLLAGAFTDRRSRYNRLAEPVVNTLAEIAKEYFR